VLIDIRFDSVVGSPGAATFVDTVTEAPLMRHPVKQVSMCFAQCAKHEFLKPVLCVPVGELAMLLTRSWSATMTLMRTMGDSWSATMPGASAVERRRNLGRAHYCAPLGDAGRRFRPVVISAGGIEASQAPLRLARHLVRRTCRAGGLSP